MPKVVVVRLNEHGRSSGGWGDCDCDGGWTMSIEEPGF